MSRILEAGAGAHIRQERLEVGVAADGQCGWSAVTKVGNVRGQIRQGLAGHGQGTDFTQL